MCSGDAAAHLNIYFDTNGFTKLYSTKLYSTQRYFVGCKVCLSHVAMSAISA